MPNNYLEEVQKFLKAEFKEFNAVVMPDFFLDRFVNLNSNVRIFSKNLENVTERKGGSIDEIRQADFRGGNAANTASALASLNIKTTPIVCTNRLGKQLIKFFLKSRKIDFSHVKTLKHASITTAMEFDTQSGKVNVMLRDVGDLANFGPQNLNSRDFNIIEKADYICIFNWAGTRRFGTQLAQKVFSHVKTNGKGKTYYDTADPTPNKGKIKELIKILQGKLVDILSLNENEAICYAMQINGKIQKLKNTKLDELARESARTIALNSHARIDLHTTSFSATFTRRRETIIPAFKIPVLRATGAGDAWNAGNIIGDAHELSDGCRLTLANLVAAFYVSHPEGKHPSKEDLIRFYEKLKRKTIL